MGVVSHLMARAKTVGLSQRRMYYGLLALLVLAVTAVAAARLSSPLLLAAGWQSGNTETPYGVLMVCLATLFALVPLNRRVRGGVRFCLAVVTVVATGTLGHWFLPVGGYDLYACTGLYGYALLAGIGYLVAGAVARPRARSLGAWWAVVWTGGTALVLLSVVFFAARSGAVTPGPAAGEWKRSLRPRVLLSSPVQTAQVPDSLLVNSQQASAGVVDLGPGPGGQPSARLVATDRSGIELVAGSQTVWRLRVPLFLSSPDGLSFGPENALRWAKWTDAGGVVFAVNALDWRASRRRGSYAGYHAVMVFQVGP